MLYVSIRKDTRSLGQALAGDAVGRELRICLVCWECFFVNLFVYADRKLGTYYSISHISNVVTQKITFLSKVKGRVRHAEDSEEVGTATFTGVTLAV